MQQIIFPLKNFFGIETGKKTIIGFDITRRASSNEDYEVIYKRERVKLPNSNENVFIELQKELLLPQREKHKQFLAGLRNPIVKDEWLSVIDSYLNYIKQRNIHNTLTTEKKFEDYLLNLTDEQKRKLIDYLKRKYIKSQPQKIVVVLFALNKLNWFPDVLNFPNKTFFAEATLTTFFNRNYSQQSINKNINLFNATNKPLAPKIDKLANKIWRFISFNEED